MKKTYMIPTLMVVQIKTTGMLATSVYEEKSDQDELSRFGDFEDEY